MMRRLPVSLRSLRDATDGAAMIEFAFGLPLLLLLLLGGIELTNLTLTNIKAQQLATMAADLVAQRGASQDRISEKQIYDIQSAIAMAARPYDALNDGRLVITAMVGEDTNDDRAADVNRIKWQRFVGRNVSVTPVVGCSTTNNVPTLANPRQLRTTEVVFHAQVTLRYRRYFGGINNYLNLPTQVTRTATFLGRGAIYKDVLTSDGYAPRSNCTASYGGIGT